MLKKVVIFKEGGWEIFEKPIPETLRNLKYSEKIKTFTEPCSVFYYAEKLSEVFEMELSRTKKNYKIDMERLKKYDGKNHLLRIKKLKNEILLRRYFIESRF